MLSQLWANASKAAPVLDGHMPPEVVANELKRASCRWTRKLQRTAVTPVSAIAATTIHTSWLRNP